MTRWPHLCFLLFIFSSQENLHWDVFLKEYLHLNVCWQMHCWSLSASFFFCMCLNKSLLFYLFAVSNGVILKVLSLLSTGLTFFENEVWLPNGVSRHTQEIYWLLWTLLKDYPNCMAMMWWKSIKGRLLVNWAHILLQLLILHIGI